MENGTSADFYMEPYVIIDLPKKASPPTRTTEGVDCTVTIVLRNTKAVLPRNTRIPSVVDTTLQFRRVQCFHVTSEASLHRPPRHHAACPFPSFLLP